jgi:CRISPR-associated protein Csb2
VIAFAFTFPIGRYHATPWGRNVNEADVAWPPEPVRILRALIAAWWRKADHHTFPKAALDDLIDALAQEAPLFHLPDAVHSHIRAYMPLKKLNETTLLDKKALIYDAFYRLDRNAELVAIWPMVEISDAQRDLAAHLLGRIGYLGRAESWADARIAINSFSKINAGPRALVGQDIHTDTGELLQFCHDNVSVPFDVTLSVTPQRWTEIRKVLLESLKAKAKKREREIAEATLPERLADALAIDTSEWRNAGWSSPPPLRKLIYDRPAVGPLPQRRAVKPIVSREKQPGHPEVARFVLAGRPQPRVEETLRVAEIARMALNSIKQDDEVPPIELRYDGSAPSKGDPEQEYAFYLPEDADGDGLIDHLIVYCRQGFSSRAKWRLDRLTKLWIEHGRPDEDGERGRKEWRLALEDIASPEDFYNVSGLLRPAQTWHSVTPLLKNRFDQGRPRAFEALVESYRGQIIKEWTHRPHDLPPPNVEPLVDAWNTSRFMVQIGGRSLSTLSFTRTRRGRAQPDTAGGSFRLTFEKEIPGPIALGWGSHFGLGLFTGRNALCDIAP